MSTAREMELRFAVFAPQLEWACCHYEDEVKKQAEKILWPMVSRPCHAARARKLRRRGMDVRHDGRTSTGRSRYRWAKPLPTVKADPA